MHRTGHRLAVQAIDAPLPRATTFLTCRAADHVCSVDAVRDVLFDLDGLVETVGFRDLSGQLSCIAGIGSAIWPALTGRPRPSELHPFREIVGARHSGVGVWR